MSKYVYITEPDTPGNETVLFYGVNNVDYTSRLRDGESMDSNWSDNAYIEMASEFGKIKHLGDFMQSYDGPILSEKAKTVFEKVFGDEVELLPVAVQTEKGKKVDGIYYVLNVLNAIDAIDFDQLEEVDKEEDSDKVDCVWDEELKFKENSSFPFIFRDKQYNHAIFMEADKAKELDKVKLKTFNYLSTDEYDHYETM